MSEAARPGRTAHTERAWSVRLSSPWRTRRGGFAPLKAAIFALLWVPAAMLAIQYATGSLGARPVLALVHGSGLWAVRLVVIALALTPARVLLEWPQSNALRRMIGVAAACYATAHLTLYIVQQNFRLLHVGSEIIHRFYLLIGFGALLGLLTLAATSTDATMKSMGRSWKRLHRLLYFIAPVVLLHFFLQSKSNVAQANILAGLLVWVMAWRLVPAAHRTSLWAAAALGVVATLATMGLELAWFGLATGISVQRVWAANLRFVHPRPAFYVAVWSLGALGIILARRAMLAWQAARPAVA